MKVAVGLSGGVDSTVAALMLKNLGYEVIGVTMTLGRTNEDMELAQTRLVANRLGLELKVFDFAKEWKMFVCDYLRDTYLSGKTPNPCVRCNEVVKFGLLPKAALSMGCDYFATGHYARVVEGKLFRAFDRTKDQSYFLYRVAIDILKRTLFPLGDMEKSKVRSLAAEAGFEVAEKADSQDFCGGDAIKMVGEVAREGNIVNVQGKVLGKHQGYWNYTIGKRKGLGIGGGTPYYVIGLRAQSNEVVVGFKDEAIRYDLELEDTVGLIDKTLPVKVRSAGEPKLLKDGIVGIASGQSAVFYRGDEVVGGGIIV